MKQQDLVRIFWPHSKIIIKKILSGYKPSEGHFPVLKVTQFNA